MKVTHGKRAILDEHRNVAFDSAPLPSPDLGEVLVEISLATICKSDWHTWCGHRDSPLPSVLGHEANGHLTLSVAPFSGGFATHILLEKGTCIARLDAAIPPAVAAPLNCSLATMVGAFRLAGEPLPSSMAILGCYVGLAWTGLRQNLRHPEDYRDRPSIRSTGKSGRFWRRSSNVL